MDDRGYVPSAGVFRKTSVAVSLLTMCVGVGGLLGWAFRIPALTSVVPGWTRITVNTAICMVLLGLSLWLRCHWRAPSPAAALARILGAFVAAVGAVSLPEILVGWNLKIDQLLVVPTAEEAEGTVRAGLMSPVTAICFVLLGLGMALLDWIFHNGLWPAQVLAIASALGSSFALLDFILSPRGHHVGIALPTAVALCVFPIGLLAARPDRGLTRLLRDSVPLFSSPGRSFGSRFQSFVLRYTSAAALALLAQFARLWLAHWGEVSPFLTFYPAVMIASLLAGVGPGMLCVVLSAFFADYFYLPPFYTLGMDTLADSISLEIFLLTSTGFCLLLGFTDLHRQRAQAEVQRGASRLREQALLLDLAHDAIFVRDLDARISFWNQGAARLYGWSAEEAIGKVSHDLLQTRFHEPLASIERIVAERGDWDGELVHVCRSGARVTVASRWSLRRDDLGKPVGCLEINRDISDRKRAEMALKVERARFEAMLDALPAMICLLTPDHHVAFANYAMRKEFGAADGHKCHHYLYGRDTPCDFCEAFTVLETGAPHDWEAKLTNGAIVHVYNVPFTDSDGSPLVLEMDVDVTEQRNAEEALRRSEAELKEAQRIARVGGWELDVSTGEVHWTEELYRMFGLDPVKPAPAYAEQSRLFTPASWRLLTTEVDKTMRTGVPYDLELETILPDGRHGWMQARGELVIDHGSPVQVRGVAFDITERKRAEAERQRMEASLSALLESADEMIWSVDLEGGLRAFNNKFKLSLEDQPGVHVEFGKRPEELLAPELAAQWAEMYRRARTEGAFHWEYQWTQGRTLDLSLNPVVVNGVTIGVSVFSKDITERKRAGASLIESEARYRSVVTAMAEGVVLQDAAGKIIACNASGERILGIGVSQLQSQTSVSLENITIREDGSPFPGETHPAIVALKTGTAQSNVCMGICKPGRMVTWILINSEPLFHDDEALPYGVVTTFADITDRKRAEQKVAEERQKFNEILDVLTPYVVLLTPDYHVAFANREFRRRFGESEGKRYEFLFGRTEPCGGCEAHRVLDTQQPQNWEWTGPDGSSYEIHDFPFTDTDGSKLILEMGIDVSDRKKAEAALQESETRFRVLANLVPQMVWMCHPDGQNFYFNQRWVDYTGLSLEESYGHGWSTPFHPDERQPAWEAWNRAIATGEIYQVESRLRAADGGYHWFLIRGTPLADVEGKITRWFGTCTDIEDLKHAESELRKINEDLEQRVQLRTVDLTAVNKELEAFNYAVAHDLRAPLRHVRGFSDLLIQEVGPGLSETAKHYLSVIQNGVAQMGQLIEDLLNLSRVGRQELRKQICGLRPLVDQVIAELRPQTAGRTIEWRIGDLPFIECDPPLFKQVLANLLSNAVKFTRGRSPAIIEVGQTEVTGEHVFFIRDNGVGFDMKYEDKLFGIFQRLHRQEDFEGTGVGLAIVQRIMHRHGGRVWADAALNRGATFYLSLHSTEPKTLQLTNPDRTT